MPRATSATIPREPSAVCDIVTGILKLYLIASAAIVPNSRTVTVILQNSGSAASRRASQSSFHEDLQRGDSRHRDNLHFALTEELKRTFVFSSVESTKSSPCFDGKTSSVESHPGVKKTSCELYIRKTSDRRRRRKGRI